MTVSSAITGTPERTCIGCRSVATVDSLVRMVAPRGHLLVVPRKRRAQGELGTTGRGAWLHPRAECVDAAVKARAFARAFRRQVEPMASAQLLAQLCQAVGVPSHEQGDSR